MNKNSNFIYTLDENFIKKAEAPILFLAFCLEYKNVLLSDGIYITHLPVQFDASCNGIQHLSSLITDTNLAKKVNIIEASFKDIPNDLYNECVKHIKDEIKNECLTKPEMSSLLKLDINRSFVKRTIMTIPYNVTYNGALNQIEDFFKKAGCSFEISEEIFFLHAAYFLCIYNYSDQENIHVLKLQHLQPQGMPCWYLNNYHIYFPQAM